MDDVIRSEWNASPSRYAIELDSSGRSRRRRTISVSSFGSDVSTNDQGEYSFDEVAPGRYKIVMNLYRFPTVRAPYPTIYWPAARSESEALAIQVTDAPSPQRYNFRLPAEPKGTVVHGMVLYPDGSQPQALTYHIEALPENGTHARR